MASKLGKIAADFTTSLATAMAVGATSASLQSATDDDGVALPAGRYFFAIDGNNSQKEHISCVLSGTSLTSIESLSRQGAEVSGVVRSHRVGSTVTLTDFAHIKFINDLLAGTTNFDASTPLGYDGTASITTANQFATKAYVDGVVVAGGVDASATVKGISMLSVAPASPTSPIAVGINDPLLPTAAQVAAFAGTSGTAPSSSNKFVDAADVSTTSAASKIPRFNGSGKLDIASMLTIASMAQGDLFYAASSSALTRLGAGTAGQFLKTLGASANPVWGNITAAKFGTTTRTAAAGSGTVSVTGVGFQPSVVLVFANEAAFSIGMSDGSTNVCANLHASTNTFDANNSISTNEAGGDVNFWTGTIGNFASDGFDAVYTKSGTPGTVTLYYIAFR